MNKIVCQPFGDRCELTAKSAYADSEEKLTLCWTVSLTPSFLTDECHLLCQGFEVRPTETFWEPLGLQRGYFTRRAQFADE